MQSLAQCDNNVVKITQNRVFLAKNILLPPEFELLMEELGLWVKAFYEYSPELELFMEDFVQGTGM